MDFLGIYFGCRVHTHPVWGLLSVCLSAILILYTVLLLVDILFIMSLGHPASVHCTMYNVHVIQIRCLHGCYGLWGGGGGVK